MHKGLCCSIVIDKYLGTMSLLIQGFAVTVVADVTKQSALCNFYLWAWGLLGKDPWESVLFSGGEQCMEGEPPVSAYTAPACTGRKTCFQLLSSILRPTTPYW